MKLYTQEQIALARANVERYATAQRIAEGILAAADRWVERSDEFIRERMPDGRVPRAFAVNYMTGCPVHGQASLRGGGYGTAHWAVEVFQDPWKVTCRIGGESYPSNDFGAFYRSGLQDRSLLTGDYPDDGHGWLGPGMVYRHWFVAYCCEVMWNAVLGGLRALGRAYLLTGRQDYARKALVMLERLAEVYAGMDYRSSMYATEMSPGYSGKIVNQIHETNTVKLIAEAIDQVRDAAPPATQARIEAGLLREMLRAVYDGHVRGNYGIHQNALLITALVLGDEAELQRAVDWVLGNTGEPTPLKEMRTCFDDFIFRDRAAHAEGITWAWDNLLFREGIGWESSPAYCSGWIREFIEAATWLDRLGLPLWQEPKLRRMLDWPLEMSSFGRCAPAIGDAGSIQPSAIDVDAHTLRLAYEHFGEASLGARLRERGLLEEGSFTCFEDLFLPPLRGADLPPAAAGVDLGAVRDRSRLLPGYGLALLRAGEGDHGIAAALYYGRAATEHAHFDRLNLELYAHGRKMIPDLGYPVHAAEGREPPLWTKNTAAHATVVVDQRRQDTQAPGRLAGFLSVPGLHYVDVSAPATYHHTAEYRRTLLLVGLPGASSGYLLDLFRVCGGRCHDYSLHGFEAAFSVAGLDLSPPAPGTLAGEEVAYGAAYDDPDLDRQPSTRSFYTYRGSGYSYLTEVQRGRPSGGWTATWDDGEAGLRVHFLPQGQEEVIVATGHPPERGSPPAALKYLLVRRQGDPLASCFTAVLEPFRGRPVVQAVVDLGTVAGPAGEPGRSLRVEHGAGSDTWCFFPAAEAAGCLRATRVGRDAAGQVVRLDVIGAGQVSDGAGGSSLTVSHGFSGRVVAVHEADHAVEVEPAGDPSALRPTSGVGEVALLGNARHGTAYPLTAVREERGRWIITLGPESFRLGRFQVGAVAPDGSALSTPTYLYLAAQGYYRGTYLVNAAQDLWREVEEVTLSPHQPGQRREGRIVLREPAGAGLAERLGPVAYLYDFGPGDRLTLVPHAHALRRSDGSWTVAGFGAWAMETGGR